MRRISLILILMVMLSITGCTKSEPDSISNQGIIKESKGNKEQQVTDAEDFATEKQQSDDEILDKEVHEESKEPVDAEAEYGNVLYKINTVEIGKKIGNHDKSAIEYWDEEIDQEGNLVGNEQFIWIKMTITNLLQEEQEILVNNSIIGIDSDNKAMETAAEARYIIPEQQGVNPSERFHCILAAGEEREVEIGYIVEEEYVSAPLYYCLGNAGSLLDDPSNVFLYLGELSDE